jgi:hypothetical protein
MITFAALRGAKAQVVTVEGLQPDTASRVIAGVTPGQLAIVIAEINLPSGRG